MRIWLVVASLFLAAPLEATVLVPADLGDVSREAYAIARGRVVSVETQWTTPDRRSVETIVTLAADVWLKRDLGATVRFRTPGGRIGRYRQIVVGAPEFRAGQQVVVFLGATPPRLPYVIGLNQGLYHITVGDGPAVVAPPPVLPAPGGSGKVVRGDPGRRPMALADFERRVRALAGGAQ
jgi:hypothetical protein